ncbi:hypothetical protein ANO14919_095040 [Xylariales sp. No.14919]|nr:hypothetical protein ANO14919_095040 [Xylariales sp. No.14919]
MTTQQNMPEHYNRSTPNLRGQEWAPTIHQYYPPPANISRYAFRALPSPPIVATCQSPLSPSSLYDFGVDRAGRGTPRRIAVATDVDDGRISTNFTGSIDEHALEAMRPPQITIPNHPRANEHPDVVSPQPQRPDSKLLSMWANGDELVSPIDTPETASWKNHIVSPLSDNFETGALTEEEQASWFDDTSSDEERPGSSDRARTKSQFTDAFSGASDSQLREMSHRYSYPGSPTSPSFGIGGFGEPGQDVGGSQHIDNASGRQTAQPQMHYSSGEQEDRQNGNAYIEGPNISLAVSRNDKSPSDRPKASQRLLPPPLELGERSAQEDHIETLLPSRADSVPLERSAPKPDERSTKQQKRRSGLVGFGSLRRPSAQNGPKPPPGFTEILSQLDNYGVVSSPPKARGLLSKAKHGLRIGSDDIKREKKQDEFKRKVQRNAE